MFNSLTESLKQRVITELRRFWSFDPQYKEIVPHIQGKYSFKERPQMGIIVKPGSASPIQLSADNFQGTVSSYVVLQKVGESPGLSIEWVKEDARAIQNNGGVFPTPRGVYYIEVLQEKVDLGGQIVDSKVFYIDPLLEVVNETPTLQDPLTWVLQRGVFHPGSLQLFEMPGNLKLYVDVNYTADPTTGVVTLVSPLPRGTWLSADYRYPGTSTGPFLLKEGRGYSQVLPGVVLAFGRRITIGDRMAVVVSDRRSPVALEYGGRWEANFDLDIMARDVVAQGELCDRTMLYLWGIARNRLSGEGIEITTVSFGGESEEVYDENGDDYFYNGSISLTIQSEWAIHVPLDSAFGHVSAQSIAQAAASAGMADDERIQNEEQNLQLVGDLDMLNVQDPFFRGGKATYEKIS